MVGTRFQNGAYLNVFWNNWFDQIDEPFRVQTVIIPKGAYHFNEFIVHGQQQPGAAHLRAVHLFAADLLRRQPHGHLGHGRRPGRSRASAEYSLQRNDVNGPWGAFVVNLSILRLDFAISPRQTVRTLSQYNSLTRQFSTSVRYNFIYRPGSDIYVVYDELQTNPLGAPDCAQPSVRGQDDVPAVAVTGRSGESGGSGRSEGSWPGGPARPSRPTRPT